MFVELKVSFDQMTEGVAVGATLREMARGILNKWPEEMGNEPAEPAEPALEAKPEEAAPVKAPKKSAKQKARKRVAEAAKPEQMDIEVEAAKAQAPAKKYTLDEVRSALTDLSRKVDLNAATSIIRQDMGVLRVSEIPVERYSEVMDLVNQKLKEKK